MCTYGSGLNVGAKEADTYLHGPNLSRKVGYRN
jgi:hypothetical protein